MIKTLILSLLPLTSAVRTIYSGEDCRACLNVTDNWETRVVGQTYNSVCRSQYNEKMSFCCTSDDFSPNRGSKACKLSPLCTWNLANMSMDALVCPYMNKKCDSESHVIRLSENST